MALTHKQKTVALRFARGAAAAGLAYLGTKLPGLLGFFNVSNADSTLVVAIAGPLLVAAEKWLRYGSDVGEGDADATSDN